MHKSSKGMTPGLQMLGHQDWQNENDSSIFTSDQLLDEAMVSDTWSYNGWSDCWSFRRWPLLQ